MICCNLFLTNNELMGRKTKRQKDKDKKAMIKTSNDTKWTTRIKRWGGGLGECGKRAVASRSKWSASLRTTNGVICSQVPRPTFGSGSGLQCVYTVVISLWGTPAPKFVLEPPKTVFYWILLCIRKPQAEFQKFSSTHVSPSNRFISSPQLPLLVGTKDEEYLPIWTLYFSVHVSLHFFVDDSSWPCRWVDISITALWSLADLYSGWKGIFWVENGTFCFILLAKVYIIIQ